MAENLKAVIIGSGFGGSITGCRLSKKWPGQVMILERGKRYPLGSFPRTVHDTSRNFWNIPQENVSRPKFCQTDEQHGMWDLRFYRHMAVVLGAGLGGGSLVYANVYLEPPEETFDARWPLKKADLQPYYAVVKEVLGSRPIPQNDDPRRKIIRTELFQRIAGEMGRDSELVPINVFFGDPNDPDNPLDIGVQAKNRYGALQTSCTYCAECDIGCNYQSKNTLDLNYLYVAEHRYKADIRTQHLATKIVPLGKDGKDDPGGDGSLGYRVYFRDLVKKIDHVVTTDRVVLSAGTLGSTEFLLRCRDVFGTLPKVSSKLGEYFSGNGDFVSLVMGTKEPANPNYGPVITQRIDFNLYKNFKRDQAFIMEDASYPAIIDWLAEGSQPGILKLRDLGLAIKDFFNRFIRGNSMSKVGYIFSDLLKNDMSYHTTIHLCMGLDKSDGRLFLDKNNNVDLDWPYKNSLPLYNAILRSVKEFYEKADGKIWFPIPNWNWPFRQNGTVHSLGGCILADNSDKGVTSADRKDFGQVFEYENLYVADGAIVPTAIGPNPTATISALSELVAEGITGISPDADL